MGIDWYIETHESVRSTQEVLKDMARMDEPEGHVIHALEQTKGHGRHGRPWISEKGNLYLSLLLKPDCKAQKITQFSLLTALAVADTVRHYVDNPDLVMLKWPNDVFIDGQKCAGILLETELGENGAVKWLVIGVGINVHKAPPDMGVGIQDYTERLVDIINIRNTFLKNMASAYALWSNDPFDTIRKRWLSLAHKRGTAMEIRIGVQIERGIFHDLDPQGNLLLKDNELRIKTVSAGEVHFLNKDM
jgi:BirA family transcriptional regulator, biotin operon repressor / biotin---[acetyl-CoA-carboxylase] ligase